MFFKNISPLYNFTKGYLSVSLSSSSPYNKSPKQTVQNKQIVRKMSRQNLNLFINCGTQKIVEEKDDFYILIVFYVDQKKI